MKKLLCIYTPVNPTRPYVGRLRQLHQFNVKQQNSELFDYYEEEVVLPPREQREGLYRGQNVIHHFNQFYHRMKHDYKYICKWDDDIILPSDIISKVIMIMSNPKIVGCGLFQEDYGAPSILMESPLTLQSGGLLGWYGAFSRFYIYLMNKWGEIPVVLGSQSGDPDNAYQIKLKGLKEILDIPYIHLDHRAYAPDRKYFEYGIAISTVNFFMRTKLKRSKKEKENK